MDLGLLFTASLFCDCKSRRVSSVPDVNINIAIDFITGDNIVTSIYSENVPMSTKRKGGALMKQIEIRVGYMVRLSESY